MNSTPDGALILMRPDELRTLLKDVLSEAANQSDQLIELSNGAYGLSGWTLKRWAADGRLSAFRAERGKLVAWDRDVRAAIEAEPYVPPSKEAAGDQLEEAFGEDLVAGGSSQ